MKESPFILKFWKSVHNLDFEDKAKTVIDIDCM